MSSLKAQIINGSVNGGGEDHLKAKAVIYNCLDDILMANETAIVLPPHSDLAKMHPIVLPPEIKVIEPATPAVVVESHHHLVLQVPEVVVVGGGEPKNGLTATGGATLSVSPHSNCSNESLGHNKSHHHSHHHHHHHRHRHHNHHHGDSHDTDDKENDPTGVGEGKDEDHHRQHHHHHHHHRHHHHQNGHTKKKSTEAGDVPVPRPDQVLRKYIIKKITIRKQDGSTKEIIIKKPVDAPNGPVKLTKVLYCTVLQWMMMMMDCLLWLFQCGMVCGVCGLDWVELNCP